MELTPRQRAITVGAILGDGTIENRWRNPRLRFAHTVRQKEYLFWKYNELRNVASSKPMLIRERHKAMGKVYETWQFGTRAVEELWYYWNIFYSSGRKTVPEEITELLTSPLSLAVWFMDDGYKRNDCNAFRLSTDCFSRDEQKLLQSVLQGNFGIESALHRKRRRWNIYIPETSARRFVEVVRPYIVPVLSYKIALAP